MKNFLRRICIFYIFAVICKRSLPQRNYEGNQVACAGTLENPEKLRSDSKKRLGYWRLVIPRFKSVRERSALKKLYGLDEVKSLTGPVFAWMTFSILVYVVLRVAVVAFPSNSFVIDDELRGGSDKMLDLSWQDYLLEWNFWGHQTNPLGVAFGALAIEATIFVALIFAGNRRNDFGEAGGALYRGIHTAQTFCMLLSIFSFIYALDAIIWVINHGGSGSSGVEAAFSLLLGMSGIWMAVAMNDPDLIGGYKRFANSIQEKKLNYSISLMEHEVQAREGVSGLRFKRYLAVICTYLLPLALSVTMLFASPTQLSNPWVWVAPIILWSVWVGVTFFTFAAFPYWDSLFNRFGAMLLRLGLGLEIVLTLTIIVYRNTASDGIFLTTLIILGLTMPVSSRVVSVCVRSSPFLTKRWNKKMQERKSNIEIEAGVT